MIAFQSAMLHSQGWRIQLGSLADWVQALGTVAAFGALLFAAREWRAGQAARRAVEANQARLIIVEPEIEGSYDTLVIRNRSESPVFNIFFHVGETARRMTSAKADWVIPGEIYWGIGSVGSEVLVPGATFGPLWVERAKPVIPPAHPAITGRDQPPFPSEVAFSFTDVHGRNWKRVGASQPVREDG